MKSRRLKITKASERARLLRWPRTAKLMKQMPVFSPNGITDRPQGDRSGENCTYNFPARSKLPNQPSKLFAQHSTSELNGDIDDPHREAFPILRIANQ